MRRAPCHLFPSSMVLSHKVMFDPMRTMCLLVRGLGISQVPSSHVGTTASIVIWLNTIYYSTTDQCFTWRNGKPLVRFLLLLFFA